LQIYSKGVTKLRIFDWIPFEEFILLLDFFVAGFNFYSFLIRESLFVVVFVIGIKDLASIPHRFFVLDILNNWFQENL